jgi:hypothetical protein
MEFMAETKTTTIDDKAFKVWRILKIIKNDDIEVVKKELYTLLST